MNNNQDDYSSCLIYGQRKTVWALLIKSSHECKADDHRDNDDSNSNANRHVSQSSGFHTQLTGCDHVSTVNGMSSLQKKQKINAVCLIIKLHFLLVTK